MIDLRRPPVYAENGDIGAVHGAAHVQTAGQGDPQLARQFHFHEVLVQVVHHALDHARGIRGRRVAVDPALRMDDVRDRIAQAAHRVAEGLQVGDKGVDLGRFSEQELDVVAAGEAKCPPQYLSARSANWRSLMMPSKRGDAVRTVKSLSPDSATWTITPGLRIS